MEKDDWNGKLSIGELDIDKAFLPKGDFKCAECGDKLKNYFDRCEKPDCKEKNMARAKKLIEESNRLEEERRNKPVTLGEVEDMIENAISNLDIDVSLRR